MTLYKEVRKQPWSQELSLPADLLYRLAQQFVLKKDYSSAQACAEAAHLAEPKNSTYKKSYFENTLTLADKKYKKLTKDAETESEERKQQLIDISGSLKKCWDKGFDSVPSLKEPYQKLFGQIYGNWHECVWKTP